MRPAALLLGLLATAAPAAAPPPPVDYLRHVRPLLHERCVACHGGLQQKGGLRLDTAALARQGGNTGPAVVPGLADDSLLLDRVTSGRPARRMPPEGASLTAEQVALLRVWIDRGAAAPAGETPEADPRQHWAFRPPLRPLVPTGPAVNPIDRFLAREWQRHGLQPAPPAERATLVRRLYLDLLGLPPTPEQLRAHLADDAPDAYERLVDRLLASPHYGERWARHWMDVWRYSDWYGRRSVPDVLNSYGMIWRWRDWIVRSLNADQSYDRMVQEMLAGDELAPTDGETLAATGFLVRNFFRWNYHQWMRDNIEHTGKAFLGLTLQCAQCHDHKYDPISQLDYFRFRAFFEPLELRHDRVPGEPDPGVFPKYSYGASYRPIRSGLVRVFDEKPDALTYVYARGDERARVPDKPPVAPGVPGSLGGTLVIVPVELPVEAAHPGLLPRVQEEETAVRLRTVQARRAELDAVRQTRVALEQGAAEIPSNTIAKLVQSHSAEAVAADRLAAAEADLAAVRARIAADNARHGRPGEDASARAAAAARAEKVAAYLAARAALAAQEQALAVAALAGPAAEVAKREKAVVPLRLAADAARAAIARAGTAYTPLGPGYPTRSSGRRLALARWITARDNALAARVAVNHLWGWHFGQPLVESTANFGRNGAAPSHPELLDWLAVELMDGGWRMKTLHRRMVTSMAYRMASSHPADAGNRQRDPDNRLLWRFPPRRLEAEVIRDSLLHAAGELDVTPGGPEIAQDQGLTVPRRSLYFAHHGETRMAFLDLFDAANPNDCYRRTASVRPQQALALANSELPLRMARLLAGRLAAISSNEQFAEAAFAGVLARPATAEERVAALAFLTRQIELFRRQPPPPLASATPGAAPSTDPVRRARENLLAALFNHSDFVTLR